MICYPRYRYFPSEEKENLRLFVIKSSNLDQRMGVVKEESQKEIAVVYVKNMKFKISDLFTNSSHSV